MPVGPNLYDTVVNVLRELTTVDPSKEVERAGITAEVVRRMGGAPWGRKARNKDGTNLNDDGLCYLLPDGRFEIYDILVGLPPGRPRSEYASWDYAGTFSPGENGYFSGGAVPSQPTTPPTDSTIAELRRQVTELQRALAQADADRANEQALIAELRQELLHPSYDEMMGMIDATDKAYRAAQPSRHRETLFPRLAAHYAWRVLFERYSVEDLVADASERGRG